MSNSKHIRHFKPTDSIQEHFLPTINLLIDRVNEMYDFHMENNVIKSVEGKDYHIVDHELVMGAKDE